MNELDILKTYYGYDNFRNSQEEIIKSILSGKDTLALMPTGSGKSLCFQIPALLLSALTIVISPLIALMKDQVDELIEIGINATYLNSTLTFEEMKKREEDILNKNIKILYIAPERLNNKRFLDLIENIEISQIAIDEAHCISVWGHDFRTDYTEISHFINRFSKRPIVTAFTATATIQVRKDIIDQLELKNPKVFVESFDRKNIYFSVIHAKENRKKEILLEILNREESFIIYTATIKNVEMIYEFLKENNFNIAKYHAKMTGVDRDLEQDKFIKDKCNIIVATLAFGMGINKPDVRYVIHYNMPKSLENYYQEAGRAGRDGLESKAILLFSKKDIVTQKYIISNDLNLDEEILKLNQMIDYSNTTKCLRNYILNYFGEYREEDCGYCKNCDTFFKKRDITIEAQKIISCVYRMGRSYGKNMLIDVLRGSENKKILSLHFDKISTYGILKDLTKQDLSFLIDEIINFKLLNRENSKYGTISLNKNSINFLKSHRKLIIRDRAFKEEDLKEEAKKVKKEYILTEKGKAAFELIRKWRFNKAEERGVPPYIIFGDSTIYDLILKLPKNLEELDKVSGFGEKKILDFGDDIINLIVENLREEIDYFESIREYEVEENHKKDKKEKTEIITLNLLNENKSLDDIAKMRGLKKATIEGHIAKLILEGEISEINKFVSNKHQEKINDAIKVYGYEKLKPIKEILPEDISYGEIEICIAKIKSEKIKNL